MEFRLEHIGLAAQDTVDLHQWYVQTLGDKVLYRDNNVPPAFFLELPGGPLIEIYNAKSASPETADNGLAGWRHLALQVVSLETAKSQLEKTGVIFSDPIKPAGGGGQI